MATLAELLADLNDFIDDTGNTQVPEATKIRYINHGLRAMWPKVYRTVSDASLVIVDQQYEYAIPSAVGDNSIVTRVELESETASNSFARLFEYEILPMQTGRTLVLPWLPAEAGSRIRITSATHLTPLSATTDVYDGPPGTEEIPVWYALGRVLSRRLEDRIDHTRLSTTLAMNGVDIGEIMNSGQFAFAQFELLLDRHSMPFPAEG